MFKNASLRKFTRYTILIVLIAVSYMFSPKPGPDVGFRAKYLPVYRQAGVVINCDAAMYCEDAAHPSKLLAPKAVRQSRPLYIVIASVIGYPIQMLIDKTNIRLFRKLSDKDAPYPGYNLGYIILNFTLLLLCLYLLDAIMGKVSGNTFHKGILLAFCVFIASNQITKAFFWTAHQQFFSLFTPLLSIYLCIRISERKQGLNKIFLLSLLTGTFMLVYGNFIPMFFCLLFAAYRTDRKIRVPSLLFNTVLFALPTVAWMLICIANTGYYFNYEMEEYKQLVWITDALKVSFPHFLHVFYGFAIEYFHTFDDVVPFIVVALLLTFITKPNADYRRLALRSTDIAFIMFFLFFLLLGHYVPRLTFSLFPILICIIAMLVNIMPGLKSKPWIFYVAAVGWHLYNVLSYGPFC